MQFRRNPTAPSGATGGKRHLKDVSFRLTRLITHARLAAFALLTGISLSASPVRAATLHYDAFLSGIPIGSAVVEISISDHAYRVSGTASSQGVAHLFSDWRSDFLAAGRFQHEKPVLTSFAYDEREKKKHRVLWLSADTVRHVKNGLVRASHPVRGGTDILTAFFLQADCWNERQLHTGRYDYRVTGRPSSETDGCHFEVSDEEGDRSRFHVRFGEQDGLRVPIEARTKGLLRGRIKLRPADKSASIDRAPEDRDESNVLLAERP